MLLLHEGFLKCILISLRLLQGEVLFLFHDTLFLLWVYQELFDSNQRMITVGNKLNDISERYFNNGKKRSLISELLNLVDTLNSKRKKTNFSKVKLEKKKVKKTKEVLEKELQSIRKEKKNSKVKPVKKHFNIVFKIGDKVRIEGSTTIGIIDNIEKNNAVVNYDTFTTKTNISKLEIVK